MTEHSRLDNEFNKVEKDITYIPYFIAVMDNYWDDNLKSCIGVIEKVINIALAGERYKEYVELSLILAKYKIEVCDYDGAMSILINICEGTEAPYYKFKSQEILLNANNLLCKLYCRIGNYDMGMSLGVKNIVYTQELLKPEIRINTILELANIAICSGDYNQVDMALEDIGNMEAMLTEKNKIHRDIIALRKSVEVNDITWAIVYINRLWDIIKENKHPYKLEYIHALELRAILNQKRELEVQAEKDFQEVDKLTQEIGYVFLYGENKLKWANYMMAKQKEDEAIKILKSIENSTIIPHDIVKSSCIQLAQIYSTQKEWELAYNALKKADEIDTINGPKQSVLQGRNVLNILSKINIKNKEFFALNIDAMKNGQKIDEIDNDINKRSMYKDNALNEIEQDKIVPHTEREEIEENKDEINLSNDIVQEDKSDLVYNDLENNYIQSKDKPPVDDIDNSSRLYQNREESNNTSNESNNDFDVYDEILNGKDNFNITKSNTIRYQDIPKNNALQNYENIYGLLNKLSQIGKDMSKSLIFKGIDKELYNIFKDIFRMEFIIIEIVKDNDTECTVIHNGEEIDRCETIFREFKYLANYCMQERVNIKVGNGNFYDYHTNKIEDLEGIVVSSLMAIPIFSGEKVVGSIGLASYKSNYFDRNDLCTLKILASYIGMNLRSGELLRHIKYLENYDRLTGLLGRTEFMKSGEESFKYNQMHNKNTSIIMFFVDDLKHINDRYGYEVGDNVLKEFGEILNNMTSGIGYAGRYSGETFAVFLNNATEKEDERFCKLVKKAAISREFETKKGIKITTSMSGGLYKCDEYTMRFSDAVKYAESALYRARLIGSGYIMSYNENKSSGL